MSRGSCLGGKEASSQSALCVTESVPLPLYNVRVFWVAEDVVDPHHVLLLSAIYIFLQFTPLPFSSQEGNYFFVLKT